MDIKIQNKQPWHDFEHGDEVKITGTNLKGHTGYIEGYDQKTVRILIPSLSIVEQFKREDFRTTGNNNETPIKLWYIIEGLRDEAKSIERRKLDLMEILREITLYK